MSSAKWRPFCLSLNELSCSSSFSTVIRDIRYLLSPNDASTFKDESCDSIIAVLWGWWFLMAWRTRQHYICSHQDDTFERAHGRKVVGTGKMTLQYLTSQDVFVPGPSLRILDSTRCQRTPLCHILLLNLDILQGSSRLCNWLSLRRLVSWINHLPPACWSTFRKSNSKQQLGCRFDIMDYESYFFVFWHMQLYMSWYIISFFGFTLLNILHFFKYSCTNIFL